MRVSNSHGLALLLGSLWTFRSGRGNLLFPDRGLHSVLNLEFLGMGNLGFSYLQAFLLIVSQINQVKRRKICDSFEIPAWEKMDEEFNRKLSCCQPPNGNFFWSSMDGAPVQEGVTEIPTIEEIFVSREALDLSSCFRGPNYFVAGGVHKDLSAWQKILINHPNREQIFTWISNKVDAHDFVRHFSGTFKEETYDSDFPPPKCFRNHASCKKFSTFISDSILNLVAIGAVRVWGKVELHKPPYLVLPLTVEPSKPRLCLDTRFFNLWMNDCSFSA